MINAFIFNGMVVYSHFNGLIQIFSFRHPVMSSGVREDREFYITFVPNFSAYQTTVTEILEGTSISCQYDEFADRIRFLIHSAEQDVLAMPDNQDLLASFKESVELDRSILEVIDQLTLSVNYIEFS